MFEWILRRARLRELLLRAVDLRIADVVSDESIGLDGEEDRPVAARRMVERAPSRLEDAFDMLSVDLDRLHPVRDGALRDVLDRHVLPARRGLGPMVVLTHEDGWHLPQLGEVERLVERADV